VCVVYVNATTKQTVKENPSLLLSHSDSKQRPHVNDTSDDKKDQRKKKLASQGKSWNTTVCLTCSSVYETLLTLELSYVWLAHWVFQFPVSCVHCLKDDMQRFFTKLMQKSFLAAYCNINLSV